MTVLGGDFFVSWECRCVVVGTDVPEDPARTEVFGSLDRLSYLFVGPPKGLEPWSQLRAFGETGNVSEIESAVTS